jgi:hypothetical protein
MSTRFTTLFGKFYNEQTLTCFSYCKSEKALDDFAFSHTEEQLNSWCSLFPPPSIYEIYERYLLKKNKIN